jgi:predicted amidohydrolase YtcJ
MKAPTIKALVLLISTALLASPASSESSPGVDLVLTNAKIYTVDPALRRVQAIAIKEGKVVAVGTDEEIQHWVGDNTEVIDLEGKFVMPGFNDAHTHMVSGGLQRLRVPVGGARSLAEFQQRIRERLEDFQPGEWVVGGGWDQSLWEENRMPTREDLDVISTRHPMIFQRVDGHSSVANSLALEKAGITRDTPDPDGGEIVRDADGQPTGWLKEKADDIVRSLIPAPSRETRKRGLLLAMEEAARLGITSVQDDSIRSDAAPDGADWENFHAWRELKQEGKLTLRVTEWLPFDAPLDALEKMREEGGATDPWLKTGALKGMTDGSGGSLSAAMLEPFTNDPGNVGILRYDPERLTKMVIDREAAGFQIAIHAIGDRGNRIVLDAFEEAAKVNQRPRTRHRIEHAQFVHPDDFRRFADLGVIASMQPSHLLSDIRWAPAILGPGRYGEAYAWDAMLKAGATLAFGTDYPVEVLRPMRGLYAALTRESEEGGPEGGWMPTEKIGIADAIRAYTWGSAYAEFEDHRKGTLAPGKFADLIVLSDDITLIPARQLLQTEVLLTMVGGKIVYQKEGAAPAEAPEE